MDRLGWVFLLCYLVVGTRDSSLDGGVGANLYRGRGEVMQFTKATKSSVKLRLALFGPSGSGKTYTSLRMATGLGGKIAVIDTERGSASKYADRFTFDVLELPTRTVDTYVEAIAAAETAGYEVLIIDSLSHAWQELLVEIDRLAKAKYRGNSLCAWSEGTP